jgi:hypothetical protein
MIQLNTAAQVFEGTMLVCFGFSWPIAIFKTWRTKRTEGLSFWFLLLIFTGYLAGVTMKLLRAADEGKWPEPVTLLYVANGVLVGIELLLYLKYTPRPPVAGAE